MADWKEQSLRLWKNMGSKQRYILLGSAALLFAAILAWSYWWGGHPDMVPLFTNMDIKDAGEVQAKLKEMKVPYEIGGNGTAILVSAKDVYRIRLELASQGLPRGSKGFEIFEQSKFGATDFQNKVNLIQALQGELTRTIEQLEEVEKARVHIVLPEDSLYKKNEKPATASIMLKLRPSAQLNKQQVQGIVNLVAHSIQGLKPENVTIVDSSGHVLNDSGSNELAGTGTVTQLDMTKKVQEDLQKNVQSLLEQVLGPNRAVARVSAELNFDQRTVDSQTFAPVVDDRGIIRSSQDISETYQGTSQAPGGPAGTAANIPGYVANNNNNSQSNYEKKETTRNYEINETKEKVVATPGSIRRLTVAVLVDADVNRNQQDSIMRTVSSAVGLNPARGDVISVESIPFNTDLADRQRREAEAAQRQEMLAFWTKVGLAVVAAITLIYFIRLYVLRRRRREEEMAMTMMERDARPEAVLAEAGKELTPEEKAQVENKQAVEKLAKSKPEDVAQLIKAWLADD